MIRRSLIAATALFSIGAVMCQASTVSLSLQPVAGNTPTAGAFNVFAQVNDLQNLGIASVSWDVQSTGDIVLAKAATVGNTNGAPNPPFLLFRTTGTLGAAPAHSLTGITGAQDTVGAANNNDGSGLGYGYGETGSVQSTFTPPGPQSGKGDMLLGQFRYTQSASGLGGQITVGVTPGSFFGLFPINWMVDYDPAGPAPAGSSQSAMAATGVTASAPAIIPAAVPEPAAVVLMCLGAMGVVAGRRR